MNNAVDIELNDFLLKMSLEQKKSLLRMLKSYLDNESNSLLIEYNAELSQAEAELESNHISNMDMAGNIRSWKSK